MKPKFRAWNSEIKEIEVFKTCEEISELFLALSADDGFYSSNQQDSRISTVKRFLSEIL